nr:hypothetical protein CFP56_70168 [Quercus suber]
MDPCQPSILDSVPSVSAEFSLPFTSVDITIPPNELPDLVHSDLAPSASIIDSPSDPANNTSPLPKVPNVRRSIISQTTYISS